MTRSRLVGLALAIRIACSACVLPLVSAWRMPSRAASTTAVVWTIAMSPAVTTTCFCFGWVHGRDFGTSCEPTRRGCEREATVTTREHTPCEVHQLPTCEDRGNIGGQAMRRP